MTNYEYKSIRITSSTGCLVMEKLIDFALNEEGKDGWKLVSAFPHSCKDSDSCLVAIFKREAPE